MCGNSDNGFEIEGDKSAEFVIDVQSPTGNIRFDGLSTGMDTVWDLLLPKDKYEISRFAAKRLILPDSLEMSMAASSQQSISFQQRMQ